MQDGASSVGVMAIQLARLAGLRMVAIASVRHHEHLRSLGTGVLAGFRYEPAFQAIWDCTEGHTN